MTKLEEAKLSVIVPVYNVEQYIRKCIDSIISQTYQNLEIILVDDGSTDNSGKIIDEFKYNPRIKIIHKSNEGILKARLAGASNAIGEYITFVDADDWIDENMYYCLMEKVNKNNIDIVSCDINRFFENGHNNNGIATLGEGLYLKNDLEKFVLNQMLWNERKGLNTVNASLCSKIIRKELLYLNLQRASNLNIYYGEDAAVLFPTMLDIQSFYVMHKPFYHHRQRERKDVAPYIRDDECIEKLFVLYKYLQEQFEERGYGNKFQKQLDLYYMKLLELRRNYLISVEEVDNVIFPFNCIQDDRKVVIYGAGKVGQTLIKQNEKYKFCNVVLWVDKNYKKFDIKLKIASPKKIKEMNYDYIIIAVQTPGLAREIRNELMTLGISKNKIN